MAGQRDILSVGIDIGTSTTQVIFSRIAMENTAGYFTIPKVSIVEKMKRRVMVADTDMGVILAAQIEDLKELVHAYREGILKERVH